MKRIGKEANIWDRFRSRPRVLAQWLLESRENWKQKHAKVKQEVKRLKVRVADVNKSREQWKEKVKQRDHDLAAMKAEVDRLRQQVEQSDKKRPPRHLAQPN